MIPLKLQEIKLKLMHSLVTGTNIYQYSFKELYNKIKRKCLCTVTDSVYFCELPICGDRERQYFSNLPRADGSNPVIDDGGLTTPTFTGEQDGSPSIGQQTKKV